MHHLCDSNQSAQPQQLGSSAARDQPSYHNQSAQLQYIDSSAAISVLKCTLICFGRNVSAE